MNRCDNELNLQLKGIMARLSQAENNIANQFAGTSMLVQSMMGSIYTSGPAAIVSGIYNLEAGGFDLMQNLLDQIPSFDIKKLQMLSAGDLLDSVGSELDSLASSITGQLSDALKSSETMLKNAASQLEQAGVDAINSLAAIPAEFASEASDLADAITWGIEEDIKSISDSLNTKMSLSGLGGLPKQVSNSLSTLSGSQSLFNEAQSAYDNVGKSLSQMGKFMTSQSDAAKCKSFNLVITSPTA